MVRNVLSEHFVPMETFGKQLRKRAEALGISNAEAARRSGLAERRYANYVSGEREPDLATLSRIAKALSTTPDWLLGFGPELEIGPRELLLQRVSSACLSLSDSELQSIAIQVEALSAQMTGK